jgi:hypothetical protein
MFVNLDDWEQWFETPAAVEGWQISNIGLRSKPELLIESVSGSISDEQAVGSLMAAYMNSEPHAVAAYELIRHTNPYEFKFWRMDTWKK